MTPPPPPGAGSAAADPRTLDSVPALKQDGNLRTFYQVLFIKRVKITIVWDAPWWPAAVSVYMLADETN